MSRRKQALTAFVGVVIVVVLLLSLGRGGVVRGEPADGPYLTVFLIDGLNQDVFLEELNAGNLPEIQRLKEGGGYVQHGISAFPSMTGYAYYPFITGHDAVKSGVMGLRWVDRDRPEGGFRHYVGRTNGHMNRDLRAVPKTLFEKVAPDHTLAINSLVDRGVVRHEVGGWTFTMAKFRDRWWLPKFLSSLPFLGDVVAPDMASAETRFLELALDDLENRPKIQWITFATPDAHTHIFGPNEGYRVLLRHIDGLIGRYRQHTGELGVEEERIYAVITDHGVAEVTQNLDLHESLRAIALNIERGTAVRMGTSLDAPVAETYAHADGLLQVNGNTLNFLNFKDPASPGTGFERRLNHEELLTYPNRRGDPVDVIQALANTPGVELVMTRDQSGAAILTGAKGRAEIRQEPDGLVYAYEGEDPLGYGANEELAELLGTPVSDAQWLEATAGTDFPYAVPRIFRVLQNEDCADVVVTAQAGFDLALDYEWFVGNYRGGHGGMRADQLRVPFILHGPGVQPGSEVLTARSEDIGATLHHLLGLEPSTGQGRPITALMEGVIE